MQVILLIAIVLSVVIGVSLYRSNRDQNELTARVREQGGEVLRLHRARKGHPFSDTGRGWWAWRVEWRSGAAARTSWALTTREGIKEWRD
jgi:type II secretory pathway pseudopilin PulG